MRILVCVSSENHVFSIQALPLSLCKSRFNTRNRFSFYSFFTCKQLLTEIDI